MSRPGTFEHFASAVCGVRLTPAQRVLVAVAFDGAEPGDLQGDDRDLARQLFGDVDEVPPAARGVVAVVKGARVGGSYLSALRLLQLALTVPLDTLAPGELAAAIIVAPDVRLARQCLRYALGAARGVPAIAARLASESADGFVLAREGGRSVSVECLPASRGGSAVRGRSLVGAVLEETAFFRDDSAVVNDVEVYRGIAPRILPAGQIVMSSTPWAESGLLFDLFSANHGRPSTALAAHAPTLLMRPDARTRGIVERERERDPDNATREFDAVFMAAGSGVFFDAAAVDNAIGDVVPRADGGAFVAADLGFVRDCSALAVVQRDGDRFAVVEVAELRPSRGAPLVPSQVCAHFGAIARRYGATTLVADAHYAESAREHLAAAGLTLTRAPDGQAGKASTYVRARELLHGGRVVLPREPRLAAQLKAIVSKPTAGGGLAITSPRKGGAHGDLASAVVLALWHAARESAPVVAAPMPVFCGDFESRPVDGWIGQQSGEDLLTAAALRRAFGL